MYCASLMGGHARVKPGSSRVLLKYYKLDYSTKFSLSHALEIHI